jgi:tRNA threonylcarbamoyladenosine biosynthesis protein TsaB
VTEWPQNRQILSWEATAARQVFRGMGRAPTIPSMSVRDRRPRIVAIETTGRQGSVAVAGGDVILDVVRFAADLQHAVELMPAIDRLCRLVEWRPDQVEEIYVSAGPGSFTGCRIGVTAARALAQAIGAKIVRVPTVDVLACNALALDTPPEHVMVVLDAQRRQVYASVFDLVDDAYVRRGEIQSGDPVRLLAGAPIPCGVLGEGIAYHRQAIEAWADAQGGGAVVLPESTWPAGADHVFRVGRRLALQGAYVSANQLVPIYIRLPEAEERWRQRRAAGQTESTNG